MLRRLWDVNYKNLKDAPNIKRVNNFRNFIPKTELWLDNITSNQKVGGNWIRSCGKLVQGKHRVKSSNSQPSWRCGITTFQYTCRNRGLKVMSQIGKIFARVVFLMWWHDFFIYTKGYLRWKAYIKTFDWFLKWVFSLTLFEGNLK